MNRRLNGGSEDCTSSSHFRRPSSGPEHPVRLTTPTHSSTPDPDTTLGACSSVVVTGVRPPHAAGDIAAFAHLGPGHDDAGLEERDDRYGHRDPLLRPPRPLERGIDENTNGYCVSTFPKVRTRASTAKRSGPRPGRRRAERQATQKIRLLEVDRTDREPSVAMTAKIRRPSNERWRTGWLRWRVWIGHHDHSEAIVEP